MAETPSFSTLALFRIDGDVAVITGGGAGLGRIAGLALAEAGAHVCVADIDEQAAAAVVGEITAAGGAADAWTLDGMDNARIVAVTPAASRRRYHLDWDLTLRNDELRGILYAAGKDPFGPAPGRGLHLAHWVVLRKESDKTTP